MWHSDAAMYVPSMIFCPFEFDLMEGHFLSMNVKPPTKVRQHSHIKADATPVMTKSFEKLLSNNCQVIIFERMAKNYFKINT